MAAAAGLKRQRGVVNVSWLQYAFRVCIVVVGVVLRLRHFAVMLWVGDAVYRHRRRVRMVLMISRMLTTVVVSASWLRYAFRVCIVVVGVVLRSRSYDVKGRCHRPATPGVLVAVLR